MRKQLLPELFLLRCPWKERLAPQNVMAAECLYQKQKARSKELAAYGTVGHDAIAFVQVHYQGFSLLSLGLEFPLLGQLSWLC